MATAQGFADKSAFIWKIADKLRGHLKPHEYGTVMLPTLLLFRLDAVLERTKAAVLAKAASLQASRTHTLDPILRKVAGQSFYNVSPLTMTTLLSDGADGGRWPVLLPARTGSASARRPVLRLRRRLTGSGQGQIERLPSRHVEDLDLGGGVATPAIDRRGHLRQPTALLDGDGTGPNRRAGGSRVSQDRAHHVIHRDRMSGLT